MMEGDPGHWIWGGDNGREIKSSCGWRNLKLSVTGGGVMVIYCWIAGEGQVELVTGGGKSCRNQNSQDYFGVSRKALIPYKNL